MSCKRAAKFAIIQHYLASRPLETYLYTIKPRRKNLCALLFLNIFYLYNIKKNNQCKRVSKNHCSYFGVPPQVTRSRIKIITHPAPLGLTPQPCVSSGSDHNKSHIGPSCGTSCLRSIVRI